MKKRALAVALSRPRVVALIITVTLLGSAFPLYVIPNAFGENFIGTELRADYLPVTSIVDVPTFNVAGQGDAILTVGGIGFTVKVTNSYFMPVVINYSGDQLVVYVYPEKVSQPAEKRPTKNLVWNATGAADTGEEDNTRVTNEAELTQHVLSVPVGGLSFQFTNQDTVWNGTDIRTGQKATAGNYYVYALTFGRMTGPIVVTILPS